MGTAKVAKPMQQTDRETERIERVLTALIRLFARQAAREAVLASKKSLNFRQPHESSMENPHG